MTKFIHGYIKNDIRNVNDPDQICSYIRTILEFIHMVSGLGLNIDPEMAKFFIEEASSYGKSRGT
jgi:hypothetical protein